MASTREQRVDDALQQLVSRLVPSNPEEDEALDDQRWDEAIQIARDSIGRYAHSAVALDLVEGVARDEHPMLMNVQQTMSHHPRLQKTSTTRQT